MAEREFELACPVPVDDSGRVQLAHGGGGRMMHRLLDGLILPALAGPGLAARHDGAVVSLGGARVAIATDSYVASPLFFPGGDIGCLAVYGTVNDVAMCGARPTHLSLGLILEEGAPIALVRRVIESIRTAVERVGVEVVTGDTKVVDRGKGDQVFINTTGVGVVEHEGVIAPSQVRAGDAVILSGDVGRHGVAMMSAREGLAFESEIQSDCAPLHELVRALLGAGVEVHCLRDLTRGGLATGLIEIAQAAGVCVEVDEVAIPVAPQVRAACELFGLDPMYVANEGRMIAFVPAAQAERARAAMAAAPEGAGAVVIGQVDEAGGERWPGQVSARSGFGSRRVLDMLSGEQLPRIC
ncbi:hydrogenase expression/formation protein HypE [Haliangium sp.]|uniref:hydrogenase expression/formation protein HypE n=1 Tax=Haliangium sp. TaxID=2663208 RepID=UPI003D0FEE91